MENKNGAPIPCLLDEHIKNYNWLDFQGTYPKRRFEKQKIDSKMIRNPDDEEGPYAQAKLGILFYF